MLPRIPLFSPLRFFFLLPWLALLALFGPLRASAQVPRATPVTPATPIGLVAPPDTGRVFGLDDLLTYVALRHPVARQAGLLRERALQEVRFARGLFDPNATSKFGSKTFQTKDYFHDWDTQLRVPVWSGFEVKAGFERGVGQFINGENFTPTSGLSYLGVSVPLAQGLLIDERRTAVRQAQALQGLAEAERRGALNKLLLQAAKDYWDWGLNYRQLTLRRENLALGEVRFQAIRQRVLFGDLAAIDSVEALGEVQKRQTELSQAQVEFRNAALMLSIYLWNEQQQPLDLPPNARPQLLPGPADWQQLRPDSVAALTALAQLIHPELQKTRAKLLELSVENRLLRNKLLPKLNLDYNLLQAGQPFAPTQRAELNNVYLQNNYKLGVSFAYPLLLRQERSKLQINRLKQQDAQLELQQNTREIETGVLTVANNWQALREQLTLQEQVVVNAQRLRDGEQIRFANGESSVFLINARDDKLLQAQQKLAELQAKYSQTQATLRWASGGIEELPLPTLPGIKDFLSGQGRGQ